MIDSIKQLFKKISYLNAKINPTILASSFAFYLLLSIIPLLYLIFNILIHLDLVETKIDLNLKNQLFHIIIFTINLLWTSSKLTHHLLIIADEIYYNIKYRPRLKLRIISIILTILFLFVAIIMIVAVMYLGYVKTRLASPYFIIVNILQFICPFIFITLYIAIIYKYIIPIKITIKKTFKSAIIITSILFILSILYQNIINQMMVNKYMFVYGNLSTIITLLVWLYLNCYIFLVGIAMLLFKK